MLVEAQGLGVSCIVPTHARPQQLSVALGSIASQTMRPLEVLVVADLHDPQTASVVEDYARSGLPVQLLSNDAHPGASGSRNVGALHAQGAILAFLDDDDVWSPAYLANAATRLCSENVDMVVTGIRRVRRDGRVQRIVMPATVDAASWLDGHAWLTGSNVVIRRTVFDQVGGFDVTLPVMNDWDFLVRLLEQGTRYAVVTELLVEWRDHPGDRISTPTERRALGIEAFIAKHRSAMSEQQYIALASEALGIRRRQSKTLLARLNYTVKLLHLIGPLEAARRRLGFRVNASRWDAE